MATRWRWPPESWAGRFFGPVGEAELVEQLVGALAGGGAGAAAELVDDEEVLAGGEERHEVDGLEHEADLAAGGTR